MWPAVATVALVVGCGSSTSTPAAQLPPAGTAGSPTSENSGSSETSGTSAAPQSDGAFWARADAACRPLVHWFDAHPQALAGFDPNAPTAASLRRFAVRARAVPLYRAGSMTAIARRIGTPDNRNDAWSTVVADFRRFDSLTARQVSDAERGDVPGWHHDFQVKAAFLPRLGPDLVAAGAPVGNQCVALLGS
jgi:hypothetical protein